MKEKKNTNKIKFIIGGILVAVAFALLIINATKNTAAFYLSVKELQAASEQYIGKNLRVSGAVLGDSISYSPET
jgi:cytochrome c-type biogenesis protein CcmE